MYKGKTAKNKRHVSKKSVVLVVYLVLMLTLVVGTTLAILMTNTDPVTNIFKASKVTTSVEETLDGSTKSNVMIKNTGDTEAYIRAAVVVTWQDEDGNVHGNIPVAGTDYMIVYNLTDNGWGLSTDGFYYWRQPVKSVKEDAENCTTDVLIKTCTPVANKAPKDYYLNVEIIGSGIQSLPTSVVTSEWSTGVSGVSGTTLTIK